MPNRREFLRFGLSGLSLSGSLSSSRGGETARPQADGDHHGFPARRREPFGDLGSEARCAERIPGTVSDDRDQDARSPFLRATPQAGGDFESLHHSAIDGAYRFLPRDWSAADVHGATKFGSSSRGPIIPNSLSITNRLRGQIGRLIPNYVGAPPIPYLGAAYLGPTYEPFAVRGDPNSPKFTVPNMGVTDQTVRDRMRRRIGLRKQLDNFARTVDERGAICVRSTSSRRPRGTC